MNRRRLLHAAATAVPAAGIGVGAAAVARMVAPPPGPFGDGSLVCIPYGDSITAGSTSDAANGLSGGNTPGLYTGNGYRGYLNDWLHGPNETGGFKYWGRQTSGTRQMPHEGHPGWTTRQLINLASGGPSGVMYGHESQYVILLTGANDFGQGRTWQQVLADTEELVDLILSLAHWTRIVPCVN